MHEDVAEIRYATGEVAQVGDHVNNDGWKSVVEDVIATPAKMDNWGIDEFGLMLKCAEAGLVFQPRASTTWDAITFEKRAS